MDHHRTFLTRASVTRPGHRSVAVIAVTTMLVPMLVAAPQAVAAGHLNISVVNGTVVEGDDGTVALSFTVRVDEEVAPEEDIQFTWETETTAADSATAQQDYVPVTAGTAAGTGTIKSVVTEPPLGETETVITVDVRGDVAIEGDETFTVRLVTVTSGNATIQSAEAVGTIDDDDPKVSVTDTEAAVAEGDTAQVGVELTAPAAGDTVVTYTVGPPGDADTADYVAPEPGGEGQVTIPEGSRAATIDVPTVQDDGLEDDETFAVEITDVAPGFDGSELITTVTILDDEPRVRIDDPEVLEGDAGLSDLVFELRVDPPIDQDVSVQVATRDGEGDDAAVQDEDYLAASGEVTIPAGAAAVAFVVKIVSDIDGDHENHTPEDHETFFVDVSDVTPSGVAHLPAGTSATGTILDDDGLPVVSIEDAHAEEGEPDAPGTMPFTVRLSEPSPRDITLEYATTDGSSAGGPPARDGETTSGREDHDFHAVPGDEPDGGRFVVPSGAVETVVTVPLVGDDKHEPDEHFAVALAVPTDEAGEPVANPPFELADGSGGGPGSEASGTVLNDDPLPEVSVRDRMFPEGAEGATAQRNFEIELSHPTYEDVSVTYTTRDGSATLADGDYGFVTSRVTIPGQPNTVERAYAFVQVETYGDDTPEPNEAFHVDLSEPENGRLPDGGATGTGTILNDDGPRLAVEDVSVDEGGDGLTDAVFTVTLIDGDGTDIQVDWSTADGTGKAGHDYQAASGTLSFGPDQTSGAITVGVIGDPTPEPDRTFRVLLTGAVGASVFDGEAQGVIRDDDAGRPIAAIAEPSAAAEGEPVTLDASDSSDEDGSIVRYAWDPGDGSDPVIGSSPTVTHTYADDGTYRVVLTVTDDAGMTGRSVLDVDVANVAPSVDPGADTSVKVRRPVTLEATATDPGDDELTYSWDLGDGSEPAPGAEVTHTYTTVGRHTARVTVTDGDGSATTRSVVVDVLPDGGQVERLWGDNRISTALEVSRARWPTRDDGAPASRHVVLATAWNYPDALAGGTLAALLDAPILLTDTGQLPGAVADELERLGSSRVWIVGGEAAVSEAIADELRGRGQQVLRLHGADRFETAAAAARATGPSRAGEVVIALGAHDVAGRAWPDAVSAGALGSAPDPPPVLLTRSDRLPAPTERALADIEARKVYLLGGAGAVTPSVEEQLVDLGYEVERLAGSDRYATSLEVARLALSRHDAAKQPALVFATGTAFPDGLTATALAARIGAAVLLVPRDEVPVDTGSFLTEAADRFDTGVVVGGTAVVTDAVRTQLEAAITRE